MSLDELIELQARTETKSHLVYIGEHGFRIAHTDEERAVKDEVPLSECDLHYWLCSLDEAPASPGVYIPHVNDDGNFEFKAFE